LQEAGTVLHLARSGRLIAKATTQIPDGKILVDENGRRVGRVMETIGPVASPYLSVQPMTDRIEKILGSRVFVLETGQSEFPSGKRSRGKMPHIRNREEDNRKRRVGASKLAGREEKRSKI
jgi:rRNA processing protein Gar1